MEKVFVPVRLKTIESGIPLGFNVYVKLPQKHVLYVQNGDFFDQEQLERLKNKKVKKIWISGEDEAAYQEFLDAKLNAAANDASMSSEKRADIVSSVASDALDKLKMSPDSEEAFNEIEKAGKNMTEVVNKNPDVLKALFKTDSDDDITVTCAVNTSSLAVRVAKLLAFDAGLLEIIGSASLLRDISISKMGDQAKKLFITPYEEFTEQDWELYKCHPERSVEMVSSMPNITSQTKDIILNHEERRDGKGFPKGVDVMTMQAEIVALCSQFDRYTTALGMSRQEAFDKVQENKLAYTQSYVDKLHHVLKSLKML